MARKVDKPKKSVAPSGAIDASASDINVLVPDMQITIDGRAITVREYRCIEGLRLRPRCSDLVKDLAREFEKGEGLVEDIMDVLGMHAELVSELVAQSADVDVEWIASLDRNWGDLLVQRWWAVNGPFFVGQVIRRLGERITRKARQSAGATSSLPSATAAAAAQTNSESATPTGS